MIYKKNACKFERRENYIRFRLSCWISDDEKRRLYDELIEIVKARRSGNKHHNTCDISTHAKR